jgi:hypothetical protein
MAKVGRPLKFENPKHLAKLINDYFEITPLDKYTVTGLALYTTGSKQLLNDYQARDEYKDIITTAKLWVEHSYELSLREKGRAGDIFALKNFGWVDKAPEGDEDEDWIHDKLEFEPLEENRITKYIQ